MAGIKHKRLRVGNLCQQILLISDGTTERALGACAIPQQHHTAHTQSTTTLTHHNQRIHVRVETIQMACTIRTATSLTLTRNEIARVLHLFSQTTQARHPLRESGPLRHTGVGHGDSDAGHSAAQHPLNARNETPSGAAADREECSRRCSARVRCRAAVAIVAPYESALRCEGNRQEQLRAAAVRIPNPALPRGHNPNAIQIKSIQPHFLAISTGMPRRTH